MTVAEPLVAASRAWWAMYDAATQGIPPAADPRTAIAAARDATTALAAAAAHSALRRVAGWRPAMDAGDVSRDLGMVLPSEWDLVRACVPSRARRQYNEALESLAGDPVSLSSYYEHLLTHDWRGKSHLRQESRRTLGAFHTPDDLARRTVARTAQVIVRASLDGCSPRDAAAVRHLASLRVADLAVGVGRFPVAWIEHLRVVLGSSRRRNDLLGGVVRRLELTDVDRTALELAAVACAVALRDVAVLSERDGPTLRHANALLRTRSPDPRLLAAGLFWHPDAGVALEEDPVDLVLGNPPWERVRVEPRHLLRGLLDDVAQDVHADSRHRRLRRSRGELPLLHDFIADHVTSLESGSEALRADPRLSRSTRGELYTHAMFTELALRRVAPGGWTSMVVKASLLTSAGHAALIRPLLEDHRVHEVWEIQNQGRIFDIDSRERFALLIAGPPAPAPRVAAGLTGVDQIGDDTLLTTLDDELLKTLGTPAGALPTFPSRDLPLLRRLAEHPRLDEVYPDANFGRLLHLTNHSASIRRSSRGRVLPVWEGRMIGQYRGRAATWSGVPASTRWGSKTRPRPVSQVELDDPSYTPRSRWWVDEARWEHVASRHKEAFSLVWRNASSPFNRRTMIATILPRLPTIQSLQLLQLPDERRLFHLCGVFNSLVFDWLLRKRLPGIDITGTVIRQMPVPDPATWTVKVRFGTERGAAGGLLLRRVAALLADDARLHPAIHRVVGDIPESVTVKDRHPLLREVDVLVAWAYGIDADDLAAIAETFPGDVAPADVAALRRREFGTVYELSSGNAAARRRTNGSRGRRASSADGHGSVATSSVMALSDRSSENDVPLSLPVDAG